jgi:hypothetical protein
VNKLKDKIAEYEEIIAIQEADLQKQTKLSSHYANVLLLTKQIVIDNGQTVLEKEYLSSHIAIAQGLERLKTMEARLSQATERIRFVQLCTAQKEVMLRNSYAALEAEKRLWKLSLPTKSKDSNSSSSDSSSGEGDIIKGKLQKSKSNLEIKKKTKLKSNIRQFSSKKTKWNGLLKIKKSLPDSRHNIEADLRENDGNNADSSESSENETPRSNLDGEFDSNQISIQTNSFLLDNHTVITLRPESEGILRTIFRHIDSEDTGLVPASLLLEVIAGNALTIDQNDSDLDVINKLRSCNIESIESPITQLLVSTIGAIGVTRLVYGLYKYCYRDKRAEAELTWGEFLLLLVPSNDNTRKSLKADNKLSSQEIKALSNNGIIDEYSLGLVPLQLPTSFIASGNKGYSSIMSLDTSTLRREAIRLCEERAFLLNQVFLLVFLYFSSFKFFVITNVNR